MADFLDQKRNEIDARLKELRPLIDEYERLEAAAAALAGVSPGSASRSPAPARAAKPKRSSRSSRAGGRPKGSGKRAHEALALVTAQPGITIPQLAERMGIKQNYLYRVLPSLASQGLVRKHDRGWHPTVTA